MRFTVMLKPSYWFIFVRKIPIRPFPAAQNGSPESSSLSTTLLLANRQQSLSCNTYEEVKVTYEKCQFLKGVNR